ncbi:MAG: copper resistance protein CopC [Steroidobacter sp.]
MRKFILIPVFCMLPLLAHAHAHLLRSIPSAQSTGITPDQITLEFNEAARLTALTLTQDGAKEAQKITPLPTEQQRVFHIVSPKLKVGTYILTWHAMGDDGHLTSGTVRFTVTAQGT